MKGMLRMSESNKIRAWELLVRIVAIAVCVGGPALGYQLKKLDDSDRESMQDRNQLRERVAITEEKARYIEETNNEIKAALRRIEDKIDRHSEQSTTPK